MRRTKSGRRTRKLLLALSVLVAMVLVAIALGSRVSAARVAAKDVESAPALPKTRSPKDTTPPATVQNLRRTDTVDLKAVAAACEPDGSKVAAK